MNDFYKTCRWCHWFKNGKCLHGKTFRNGSETDIVYLAEEGVIMQAFFEELEAAKIDWVETIDEAVTTALQNAVDERAEEAAEIIEPEEFCCKYFM